MYKDQYVKVSASKLSLFKCGSKSKILEEENSLFNELVNVYSTEVFV